MASVARRTSLYNNHKMRMRIEGRLMKGFGTLLLALGAACTTGSPSAQRVCEGVAAVVAPPSLRLPGFVARRNPRPRDVLVFVHGILGDGVTSWTSKSGTYWPSLVASDPDLKGYDIYVFEYPTSAFGGCMAVTDLANDLRLHLRDAGLLNDYTNIIFVAHSMGGLVVQQLLLRNREEIVPKVPAILLFGTPSGGSRKADLARLVATCSQLDDLRTLDQNSYLQSLYSDWKSANLDQRVTTYCAVETLSSGLGI